MSAVVVVASLNFTELSDGSWVDSEGRAHESVAQDVEINIDAVKPARIIPRVASRSKQLRDRKLCNVTAVAYSERGVAVLEEALEAPYSYATCPVMKRRYVATACAEKKKKIPRHAWRWALSEEIAGACRLPRQWSASAVASAIRRSSGGLAGMSASACASSAVPTMLLVGDSNLRQYYESLACGWPRTWLFAMDGCDNSGAGCEMANAKYLGDDDACHAASPRDCHDSRSCLLSENLRICYSFHGIGTANVTGPHMTSSRDALELMLGISIDAVDVLVLRYAYPLAAWLAQALAFHRSKACRPLRVVFLGEGKRTSQPLVAQIFAAAKAIGRETGPFRAAPYACNAFDFHLAMPGAPDLLKHQLLSVIVGGRDIEDFDLRFPEFFVENPTNIWHPRRPQLLRYPDWCDANGIIRARRTFATARGSPPTPSRNRRRRRREPPATKITPLPQKKKNSPN